MFGLSAEQYANEPADKLFTNLYIYGQMQDMEQRRAKYMDK